MPCSYGRSRMGKPRYRRGSSSDPLRRARAPLRPSVEGQHGPCDFAGLHRAEGFVDVAETAALGHHVVEVEAALAVEIEVERDVEAKAVGPHARGLHLAFRP